MGISPHKNQPTSTGSSETMNKDIEFFILEEQIRDATGRIVSRNKFLEVDTPEAEILDTFLKRFNRDSDEFLHRLSISIRKMDNWPVAIILFNRELHLAGHVLSVRRERSDFSFSTYVINNRNYSFAVDGIPTVGSLVINNRKSVEEASGKSELFKLVWKRLSALPASQNWICTMEVPPEDKIIDQTKHDDDKLFLKLTGFAR